MSIGPRERLHDIKFAQGLFSLSAKSLNVILFGLGIYMDTHYLCPDTHYLYPPPPCMFCL